MMRKGPLEEKVWLLLWGLAMASLLSIVFSSKAQERPQTPIQKRGILRVVVSADQNWTDTGLDVEEGQELYFKASGMISLQKGNPMAYCGPEGYNLKTVQQPLPEENMGALIGRVVYLVSVEKDEETGEEIRNEIVKEFAIGAEKRVQMPINGRLFLGINENVVGDNSGEFEVILILVEKPFAHTPS